MAQAAGRHFPLSVPRRFICDLVHFARKVPSVPVERRMQLAGVSDARARSDKRPSWCAIFTKAYAILAARRPALRTAYLSFPRHRLYEHFTNVASIAVERRIAGEDCVLFGHIRSPETVPLIELNARLGHFKEAPIQEVGSFRHCAPTQPPPSTGSQTSLVDSPQLGAQMRPLPGHIWRQRLREPWRRLAAPIVPFNDDFELWRSRTRWLDRRATDL